MANRTKLTDRAREQFLAVVAKTANVSEACRRINMSRTGVHNARNAHPEFAAAWDEALEVATDALAREARRRAIEGWNEPVFHQGRKCGVIRRYSDRMLELLLKAHRPEKFRERLDMNHSGRVTLEQLLTGQSGV
jgi:hypothetical protein